MKIPMVDHQIIVKAKQQDIVVGMIIVQEVRECMETDFKLILGTIYKSWYKKRKDINKSKSLYEYNGHIKEQQ